tara:strand:+ start:281 stop:715 length:435 start_codon:yes stop_codon:yes gene_type:complete
MILISHRGNISGPDEKNENNPKYVDEAMKQGFEVEIDVWHKDNQFFLGHSKPQYPVDVTFLKNKKLWCHAKSFDALQELLKIDAHCFWHEEDAYTLTNRGYVWAYPGQKIGFKTICVKPELTKTEIKNFCGVCSDYIGNYKNKK